VYDATPVENAIARCDQLLETAPGPYAEAAVTVALAALHAMATRFDQARELYAHARRLDEEIGSRFAGAAHCLHGATIARLAGDLATAERELRAGYEALREMGEKGLLSSVAGDLGRALYALQRFAEAQEMAAYARQITSADDVSSEAGWRSTRARLLSRSGDHVRAVEMAEAAVALMEPSDMLNERAQTLLDLGEVLGFAGRPKDAAEAIELACGLFEAKGNIAGAAIARASMP
jgi:tetratricopeptide (TPR) repeat protein